MLFKQIWTDGLAAASYMVGAEGGDVAVVDPLRDVDRYLDAAREAGVRIAHIFETHIHADFCSGARELAARTGAALHLSDEGDAEWQYGFPHQPLHDGDTVTVGGVRITAVHTPGHTPEHLMYLLAEGDGAPTRALTGDFLFVGDVGRPDLLGQGAAERLGDQLYESVQTKLAGLPDALEVWPAHGAGSLCGKALGTERSTTLGAQRMTNYALQPMLREEFVRTVLAGQPAAPAYFRRMKVVNRDGPPILGGVPAVPALSAVDVKKLLDAGAAPVDLRHPLKFAPAHLPGSVNISPDPTLSGWAGAVLDPAAQVVFVTDHPERLDDAARQLVRVGLDNMAGYLDGGVAAWQAAGLPLAAMPLVAPEALLAAQEAGKGGFVLDVRTQSEWDAGHVPDAFFIPLTQLAKEWPEIAEAHGLTKETPVAVMCAAGNRSSIGASLLQRMGYTGAGSVPGGFTAYRRLQRPAGAAR